MMVWPRGVGDVGDAVRKAVPPVTSSVGGGW